MKTYTMKMIFFFLFDILLILFFHISLYYTFVFFLNYFWDSPYFCFDNPCLWAVLFLSVFFLMENEGIIVKKRI